MREIIETPEAAFRHYAKARAGGESLHAVTGSLINRTWSVGAGPDFALQLVAAQFGDEVNARIELLGRRLANARVRVPQLLRTDDGELSLPGPEGRRWRLLTWIPGRIRHAISTPADAASAAALVARFHDALFKSPEGQELPVSDFHDTDRRFADLARALERASGHPHEAEVRSLAEELERRLQVWRGRHPPPPLPPRPGHGDLKISNIVFEPHAGNARALIDLDTLGRYPLDAELGDALRSWCNIAGEDHARPRFDRETFAAAIEGYFTTSRTVTRAERAQLVHGLGRITLELVARFLTDVIEDRYFAWDPAVAPSRAEHNLLRARGQLELARHIASLRADLEAIIRRHRR